jgi:hypothetical protein
MPPKGTYSYIGQWQNGFFTGVAPEGPNTAPMVMPKAPWKLCARGAAALVAAPRLLVLRVSVDVC